MGSEFRSRFRSLLAPTRSAMLNQSYRNRGRKSSGVKPFGQPSGEVDRRGLGMAGAVHFQRPARPLHAANEVASLLIGRRPLGKVECIWTNPSHADRSWHSPVTGTRRAVGCEAAVGARKRLDRRAGVLQPLTEQVWRDVQGLGGFGSGEIEDLAQDVGETVRPVETLEHAERAADLDFLGEQRAFGIGGSVR